MGFNKMRLVFMSEEGATTFFSFVAVELRSQGCLLNDERTKAWIKEAPSDGESEASSNSELDHDRQEPMILFDAPRDLVADAIVASLQSAGFHVCSLSKMG